MSVQRSCKSCGGTGWEWFSRSWFTDDGYYKQHCAICGGSGASAYRPTRDWIKFQEQARTKQKERERTKQKETAE